MTPPFQSTERQSTAVALAFAFGVGIGYLLVLYLLARRGGYEFATETPQQRLVYASWIGLGHLLVAAVPAYLFAKYGFLLPEAVFVVIAGYAVAVELGGGADSSLAIYGMFWLVPMAVILIAAGVEYVVRSTMRT